jgi:hypothetical protein
MGGPVDETAARHRNFFTVPGTSFSRPAPPGCKTWPTVFISMALMALLGGLVVDPLYVLILYSTLSKGHQRGTGTCRAVGYLLSLELP